MYNNKPVSHIVYNIRIVYVYIMCRDENESKKSVNIIIYACSVEIAGGHLVLPFMKDPYHPYSGVLYIVYCAQTG